MYTRLTRMLLVVHVVLNWATKTTWTTLLRTGELPASHEPRPCLSPCKLRTEDTVCSIHPLYLLWFLVVLLIFSTITTPFFLLLQMYTSTRYFKQHSSLRLWTEQLKTFMYDGQFEQVMGERYGMPFRLGFWTFGLICLFGFLGIKCQSTAAYVGLLPWPPHVLC